MENEKFVDMLPRLSYGTKFISTVMSLHMLQSDLQNWIDDLGEDVSGSCGYTVSAYGNDYDTRIKFQINEYQNESGSINEVDWRVSLRFQMRSGIMYCSMTDDERWVKTENTLTVIRTFKNSCRCMMDAIDKRVDYNELPAILRKKGSEV